MPKTKKKSKRTKPSDYFPYIDEWPNEWMGVDEDLEIGRGLLGFFTPFIQHLIDEGYAKKTIDSHGSNLNILGGEIIERLNEIDEDNRKLSPKDLILHYVDEEGGPFLSFWDPNDITEYRKLMAYGSTCRKFLKFMTRENAGTSAAPLRGEGRSPSPRA
jgi:hypothetical protein